MQSVNLNQLQINELKQTISTLSGQPGVVLSEEDNKILISKVTSFLGDLNGVIITDRKKPLGDGYFVLDISKKGLRLLKSKSVARFEYLYIFNQNEFRLNGKKIDASFFEQFMVFFDHIVQHLNTGRFEIVEVDS